MKPLVTIISPSFNQGRFIRKTIESVLNQDYENLEYIVIDGGSSDETLCILEEYKDRLRYISEKDNGQSDAINKGFMMAKGEIVAWLNSDDTYEPGCIRRAVEELGKDEKIGLVYGGGYITDEDDNKIKVFEYTQEFDLWKLVNFWDYIMQPATFFRAKFLKQAGYLNVDLNYCMDWDLWIRLAMISDVKYVPELWACSREYGETKTSTGGDKRLKEITALLKKYSKNRHPLGVVSYHASTIYAKYAKGKVSEWVLRRYLALVHKKLEQKMPTLYQDGWIGKNYSFIVPAYKKRCRILFESIPVYNPKNKLEIWVEEEKIFESLMNKNNMLPVEFQLNQIEPGLVEVRIVCSHTFYVSGDERKLSVRIRELAIE